MIIVQQPQQRLSIRRLGLQISRSFPGRGVPGHVDRGLWSLGVVDHAILGPGLVVPRHEHRNDEIISYLRQGSLVHTDTVGDRLELSPASIMLMSAGSGLSHEEQVPVQSEVVSMLQIFIRPPRPDLPPRLQTAVLEPVRSNSAWRLIAGREGSGAPLALRQPGTLMYDVQLMPGECVQPPVDMDYGWLYCMSGAIRVGAREQEVTAGGSCVVLALRRSLSITAIGEMAADLVLFAIDPAAIFTREGTISGTRS